MRGRKEVERGGKGEGGKCWVRGAREVVGERLCSLVTVFLCGTMFCLASLLSFNKPQMFRLL